ncbi:COG1361 S-layer family protein [Methanococcus voltae]|uniref:S-layer domain-like protein n=1 Tax=Methanococcus voltae (strain ATCC BAA-1334 / A3) TaxID=456320 RepID=D7DTR9_METV3|nr:COG1361 S-layer family protein [Methanococcus voltae]MCS3901383.1 cbb3-type cytochrome oxidase subunit 3 [Methanococcus voltae]
MIKSSIKFRKVQENSKNSKNSSHINFLLLLMILLLLLFMNSTSAIQMDNPQYTVDMSRLNTSAPTIIHPGDDVDIWIKITNDDTDKELKNIEVELSPKYPFETKQVNSIIGTATLSHLNEGESDIVHFKVHVDENAPSGEYPITINVNAIRYDDDYESTQELGKTYYLPIYGVAKFEMDLLSKCEIEPSETKSISLNVHNKGTGNAKYLSVSFSGSENVNIVGPTTYYIGLLKASDSNSIEINTNSIPGTSPGVYPIDATLSWIGEDGVSYSTEMPVNLEVKDIIYKNQPYVYVEEVKSITTGYELSFALANRGSSDLSHCVMTLTSPNLSKEYISYIGDLEEDDSDSGIFEIGTFNSGAGGKLPVNLEITYFDRYHEEYMINEEFTVDIPAKSDEDSNMLIYLGILAIVLLVIIYYLYKKRQKKKLAEKLEKEDAENDND